MQEQANLVKTQHDPVRAYLSEIGRRGAAVHKLTQEARLLGVRVRLAKKSYQAQGYSPAAAHMRARKNFRISPGGLISR